MDRVRLTAVLVALAMGCACSSDDPRVSSPARADRPASAPSPDAELRAALQRYVECLRAEGVDASEAVFAGDGTVEAWPSYSLGDSTSAEEACGEEISEIAFRPRGEAAVYLERAQQFAECMAEHGIADVEVSLEGIRIGPDSRNSEIRAVERECRHIMEGP